MENEFVAKFFQDIDDDVLLQQFQVDIPWRWRANLDTFGLFRGMFIQEFT